MSYVIRNCPAFVQSSYKNRDWAIENACELIDDRCCIKQNCVLKQIVEECQGEINADVYKANAYYAMGKVAVAEKILSMLDIQEC